MKRVILIYFFVVMTMLFVGCKSGNVIDNQTNKPVKIKSNNVTDYKVNMKEYISYNKKNKPFKVKYAQISGVGNESIEGRINQTLKSSITEWINKDCEWLDESQIAVKYKNSKYLSLCYTTELKDDRGEDYMSTYTRIGVTVDMQTGDRVFLGDLFKNTASLKEKLEIYNYGNEISPPIDSDDANKILHYASISEKKYFEEIYKTDPLVYDYTFTYIRAKPSFYLTDEQLVITRDENKFNDVYIDFKP
ncbi:hypothetical protein [Acetivibrio cellulolyticus]|uniref:hypothetical protein n=1 Tax=Acetivibrio cellulolyticus TaxID=35830 RepID=UPI0001E2CCDA|nr:hypothetical protein [Acetivibrio cellulolyticus]